MSGFSRSGHIYQIQIPVGILNNEHFVLTRLQDSDSPIVSIRRMVIITHKYTSTMIGNPDDGVVHSINQFFNATIKLPSCHTVLMNTCANKSDGLINIDGTVG